MNIYSIFHPLRVIRCLRGIYSVIQKKKHSVWILEINVKQDGYGDDTQLYASLPTENRDAIQQLMTN